MRQIFTILTAVFGLGLILFGSRHLDASFTVRADVRDDKRLEQGYRDSAEVASKAAAKDSERVEGCKSMPYPDLQRECIPLMEVKHAACHMPDEKTSCKNQDKALDLAMKRKNKKAVAEILATCEQRLETALSCASARSEGKPVWDEARRKVKADQVRFSREQGRAADPATKLFYQSMVGYADRILAYYNRSIRGHEIAFTNINDNANECRIIVRDAKAILDYLE